MKIVYFAWVRERVGKAEEEIVPPAGVNFTELNSRFRNTFSSLSGSAWACTASRMSSNSLPVTSVSDENGT